MPIPKIVHFLWMSKEKDEKTLQCLTSWKKHLVGYEIREWNSETFPYNDFVWTKEATEAQKWAYVTDYFRLWVLYNYGGIYMDADVLLQNNFDAFLEHELFIATEFTAQLAPHCMGAIANHNFIKQCLSFYENRHFVKEGKLQMIPIPRIMTYFLYKKYGVKSIANFNTKPIVLDKGIAIYPDSYFTIDVSDGKNIGIHLGLGSWRDETTAENPVYMNNIEFFFVKKFLLKDNKFLGRKIYLLLFLICQGWVVKLMLKNSLKIKNNKLIMQIGELM